MNYYYYKNENMRNELLQCALESLPALRRAEAERLKNHESVKLCVLAYKLYQFALFKEKGIEDLDFIKDKCGKPIITEHNNLHISLSHCKSGIACVVSDFPAGIDVEEISRFNPETVRKIADRICTENELLLLEKALNKQELLCGMWVLKEAYSKLTGKGLSEVFSKIETTQNSFPNVHFYAKKRGGKPPVYIGIASENAFSQEPCEKIVRLNDLFTF